MENGREPATKADLALVRVDLAAVEARLNERLEILRGEIQRGFDDVKHTIRDGQTDLLKAFDTFTEINNRR
jgi:hypothetical protein